MAQNFEDINEADPAEVLGKLASVKVPWDRKDVGWWFSELEMQMASGDSLNQEASLL